LTAKSPRPPLTDSIDSFFAEWSAAERTGVTAKLEELLADDFVGIGPLGFSLPKPAWLARHHQGLRYDAFDVEELQARTYGEVAIVTARESQRGTAFGNPIPEAVQATHVLGSDGESWRLAAVHMSFVAGTPGAPPIPGAPPQGT
jgi:ketosteroid isomerase-like protein